MSVSGPGPSGRRTCRRRGATVCQPVAGATTLTLYEAGAPVVSATDTLASSGSPPYTSGRLGIRADQTIFAVKNLVVTEL